MIVPRLLVPATLFVLAGLVPGSAFAQSVSVGRPPVAPSISPDSKDIAAYMAYHKARALERSWHRALPMTANQTDYDVHYYDLDLQPQLDGQLFGSVHVLASVTTGPLVSMELDFDSSVMVVDAIMVAGIPATFTHAGDLIAITLDRPYTAGENMDVTVTYHGSPAATGFGSYGVDSHNSQPIIWTLSEPYGAHTWWPCKDQPSDKADSVDIRVTVPSGMITASNGVRVEYTDNGTTAYSHWRERYPIATYLVSMTSYAYATLSDWYRPAPTDSMEIQFFYYPEQVGANMPVSLLVKEMIAAYAARFGPYPFLGEKYGHATFPWGGGMEHQTCTSLGSYSESVVAHELGHQWWGDLVTCRNFHHIWLNEGFATYCQALWDEAKTGPAAYHYDLGIYKYFGPGTVYRPDTTAVGAIFNSSLSYAKGSWVLHMLRHVMGDSLFFTALRDYRAQYAYASATTEDFQHVCEATCGFDLTKFFQQWIYGEYYPQYLLSSSSQPASGGYDVTVWIQQTQTWQKFWMPIDVTIQAPSGDSTFVARDSLDWQRFTYHMPTQPTQVVLDKDQWILQQTATTVAVERGSEASSLSLAAVPNPNPGPTDVRFTLPRAGVARVEVLDLSGRRVALLFDGALPSGPQRLAWDGADAAGRAVGAGVYWLRLDHGGRHIARKFAIVR